MRSKENSEIDKKAYVQEGAELGKGIKIGPFTHILSGAVLEDGCVIESHCVIGHPSKLQLQGADFSATSSRVAEFLVKEPKTRIGEDSIIRSGSKIYTHVKIGEKLRTGHNALIREHVALGDNCVVGTQAILDGYIKVGNKSMIQSQSYVTQSVRIGAGVFIAPGCIFLDNRKMVLGEGLEGIVVEDYVRIGAGTKVLPGVTIGKYALIGAGSVVTRSIKEKAVAYGSPAGEKAVQTNDQIMQYVKSIDDWRY